MITQETKPIKTWGGFNLGILKVNLNPLWKNRSYSTGLRPLTSYCYPPVETYWHDHVQAPRPRTPSFLDSSKYKHTCLCFFKFLWQQLNDHQALEEISFLIILSLCKGNLLTDLTRDLHKQQYEQPNLKRAFGYKTLKYKRGTKGTLISLKYF